MLLLLLLGVGRSGTAQHAGRLQTVGEDLENAAGDVLHVWTAPLRLSVSDLPALIAVTQAVILTGIVDGEIQRWVRGHRGSLPLRLLAPVQEPAPLSYLGRSFVLQSISGLLYVSGLALDSDALREAGIGCATADLANTIARHTIGRLSGRLRPMYGRGPYDFEPLSWAEWPRRSFPNGHASNSMACATFWNHHFDPGVAGPLLYLVAGALGAARITVEKHWASDTVFGFVFGWAVGRAVAGRFSDREADEPEARRTPSDRPPALYIGWRIPVP